MNCRFCARDRKLVEAHIIPRSFFGINPSQKQPVRLVTNVTGRYSQKVPKGVYDSTIVCEECEQRFSPWDDYAFEIFMESWGSFDKITERGQDICYCLPSFDYPRLKLFFMSLLWRAAVSSNPFFGKVDLGSREEVLRVAIERSDPGSVDFFGVVLQAFDSEDIGILDPYAERFSGIRFYRFYLSHVIAFIKVDSRPFLDPFASMALGPDRKLVLIHKDFINSKERQIMKKLVIADRRKSNLTD